MAYCPADTVQLRGYHGAPEPNPAEIDAPLQAIAEARKPVIIAGGGVVYSNSSQELIKFVHTTRIPVATTLLGLGGFPSDDEMWLGMLGHHGVYAANMAVQNADLIISIGSRFDDRVTMKLDGFAPQAKRIAHIDIDPAEIGKNVKTDLACIGDIKTCWLMRTRKRKRQTGAWIERLQEVRSASVYRFGYCH